MIIPHGKHCVSRSDISPSALRVLYRLEKAGFAAYLVGGGVRDLLVQHIPKDFDIATNAHPEEIKPLFPRCILIGRRFRLAHIHFGREIIEAATFRADHSKAEKEHEARKVGHLIVRDNVYGTIEEDALRRDFTINSLYYNIADRSIVDYCGGWNDIEQKVIRMIGDPIQRYQEDPGRLLRAVRFAAKLNFKIEPHTEKPLYEMGYLIHQIAPPRLFDEILKLFLTGSAEKVFTLLLKYGLFQELFPATAAHISHDKSHPVLKFLKQAMKNSDKRIQENKTLNPSFIFAVLLWHPYLDRLKTEDPETAFTKTLKQHTHIMTVPKRLFGAIDEIWFLQRKLEKMNPHPNAISKITTHPRFRAAYDFLCLRAHSGEKLETCVEFWEKYYI